MKSPELRIDFEWLEGHHHYGAGALSEIAVFVNDVCLTELEDFLSKTVRGKMRVSAEALAVWLVDNWWRIHWESSMDSGISSAWKYAHCVAASGHGFAWPDITIYGDGKFIYIDTLPTSAMAGAPVRYLNHSLQYVPVDVFEQAVDNFATAVIDRLSCLNQASPLAELWQAVQGERRDGELASWRKLEAILGFDTDLSPAGLVDKLIAMRSEIGGGAVDEFAAAGQGATPEIVSFFTDRHIRSSATPVSLPDIPTESMSRMDSSPPWVSAAAAAASLRKHWKLGTHVSNEFFGDLFRLPQ